MGGSKWIKVKMAFGLKMNSCLYLPRDDGDDDSTASASTNLAMRMPTTPTPSSSGLLLPKQSSKSNKNNICAICLGTTKPGHGHAIFTAECSHAFHFHCISSNVEHGRQSCPVCRSKWKEIPFQNSDAINKSRKRSTNVNNVSWPREDSWDNAVRRLPSPRVNVARQRPISNAEPSVFNDDDEVTTNGASEACFVSSSSSSTERINNKIEVMVYPEVPEVPKSKAHENFSILIHLKAPMTNPRQHFELNEAVASQNSRAPVDLVTVLDVSGSMAGTKLALLKQAMGFVIQSLGPMDRLSLILFSSSARRLFSLRRMTESGRREALEAVSSLSANGGTNIAEGLKKGAKVLTDRRWKNPVSSIILLSDGQDTYTRTSPRGENVNNDYKLLLPVSMHRNNASSIHTPVHTFGFGVDHDAISMHSISEISGGTFSFIENESIIQDAFAQCIGGLLSVVMLELKVEVECIDPKLKLISVKSGSYKTSLSSDHRSASIEVGDLYAEEERDFLITTDIPTVDCAETLLLKIRCLYKDPISKNLVTLDPACDVLKIQRPIDSRQVAVSIEVDRQRNRIDSAGAMSKAKSLAEQGDLRSAVRVLGNCRKKLSETISAKTRDQLCVSLDAELHEMQERMADRQVYETSGRAYVLSGLSSHSWQRATARGDSTESTSLVQAYQMPSMVDMVNLSQTMVFSRPTSRPTRSFQARSSPNR